MGVIVGPLYLRRSAFIKASPERVWEEFANKEKLAAWFGTGHTLDIYEPKVGGTLQLHIVMDGKEHAFGGKILAFEPGRELSFDNDWMESGTFAPCMTTLTFRLTALNGGTHVELIDHGYEKTGDEAGQHLEDYEGGWDNHHLVFLREIVEG